MTDKIAAILKEAGQLHLSLPAPQIAQVAKAAALMAKALSGGRKVIWFGNGGSATQSQHMAGEFVGRFLKERRSLPSISLTENMASVTAIGNDYAFDQIFSRQLEGLGQAGDVAVGLSTSGNSPNVVKALEQARKMQLHAVGLTGGGGGRLAGVCDVCICVPSTVTARIQEVHLTVGHILCALVEDALLASGALRAG
ncbi:MAG: SIS domain-containing protein [Candidatus Omnitrophica bacterium]|nr:SIS domain-containing protein [Candidatus Omnitrophota bacterium]